jgi:hypothetical protein
LRQPQTASEDFLTASARAAVAPAYQPIVNALPLPAPTAPLIDPTCDNITNPCLANIAVAYSDPSSLNAISIRVDHNLNKRIILFARYNHAPSYSATRNWEELEYIHTNGDTLTGGATFVVAPNKVNDFRVNWSKSAASQSNSLTDFHGAVVPPASVLFPPSSGYSPEKGQFLVFLGSLGDGDMEVRDGTLFSNIQRQINLVDTFSWAVGAHQFKVGIDYRRLNPTVMGDTDQAFFPSGYADLITGAAGSVLLSAADPISLSADNYSLFVQDTWKATNRLTLTYGLRWEINTPPVSATAGQPLYAVQGIFDSNPLALVPGSLWHTRFTNFAPRIGAAYQLTPKTVVRGGFGVFYDLGYGDFGSAFQVFPYMRESFLESSSLPFDLSSPAFQPPPLSTAIDANVINLGAVDPNLRTPFTLQWNAAIERVLGANQTFTVTYVGSDGGDLLREDAVHPPLLVGLGNGGSVLATRNAGYSHYQALQLQLQRNISHGLQALISYNFAKSSDTQSTDAGDVSEGSSVKDIVLPPLAPSDFDIRHSFAAAVSYEIPTPSWGRAAKAILGGWATDGILRVSSAPPINVTVFGVSPVFGRLTSQANVVLGQPFWIPDPTQPNGKALNPAAFAPPPLGQEGDFPRNSLRSPYSINQTDVALRRQFSLTERVKLDLRAEYFNVFNHPMFGIPGSQCNPATLWGTHSGPAFSTFGKVCPGTSTTNVDAGGGGSNGQVGLYAVGGPRSAQFTVKLHF